MIIYSVVMFVVAAALCVCGVQIAKGRAELINCYRAERVKDKVLYCKKISMALFIMAGSLAVSGIAGLLGDSGLPFLLSLASLVAGMVLGVTRLFHAQKKYGGGIF